MVKTITVYKDNSDDILSIWTGEEELIESFKAAASVKFKQYPNIRFELTDKSFLEKRLVIMRAIRIVLILTTLSIVAISAYIIFFR